MLIVPVRHHSPAAALQVGRLIRERRPRVVLIEGPADASELIDQLLDAATVPPVALYAYRRRGDDVRAAFYPFCAYSPEYVAMQAGPGGRRRAAVLRPAGERDAGRDPHPPAPSPAAREGEQGVPDPVPAGEGEEVGYGAFTDALAEAAGFDSFEGFWEAAFEQEAGSQAPDGYVEVMATFGGQARALASGRDRAYDDRRERAMAAAARAWVEQGVPDEAIVLVCGAAHARAIAEAYAEVAPHPPTPLRRRTHRPPTSSRPQRERERRGCGADRADPVLVPQAERAGRLRRREPRAVVLPAGLGSGGRLRRRDAPGAGRGGAARSASKGTRPRRPRRSTATRWRAPWPSMREKQAPGVDELVDAAVACFGQGHGDAVAEAMHKVLIGDAVGRITGRAGRTPLQEEFHATVERLRLPALDTPKQVLVHLAGNAVEAEQSVFLHRLVALGVPYGHELASGLGGRLAQGPLEQLGRVRERWELQWTPATDARLIERTAWGSTLAEACGRVLRERLDGAQRVDEGTEALLRMALCDLAGGPAFTAALARCEALAADSGSFPALARATYHLDGLLAYGAARKLPADRLLDLAGRLFARAVLHLPAAAVCGDEAADEVRQTLLALHELVQRRGPVVGTAEESFWEAVAAVAERQRDAPGAARPDAGAAGAWRAARGRRACRTGCATGSRSRPMPATTPGWWPGCSRSTARRWCATGR